jgi:glycosyltransferase involved in cell wall biosynthesis
MKITLTTGGAPHYELGLLSGLVAREIDIDVIGGDELKDAAIMRHPRVHFKNLHRGRDAAVPFLFKVLKAGRVYLRLVNYAVRTDSPLFHLHWPYKFVFLDRTAMNVYYKALGKKLVFTAHNVDGDARDGKSSPVRRFSLRFLYRIVDHIIVHTEKMKRELVEQFEISAEKVSVIPHGIMSVVPETALTRLEARKQLCLDSQRRVLLFFGLISPYKGLETLVRAMAHLHRGGKEFTLIIAGRIKECQDYWEQICRLIEQSDLKGNVVTDLRHVPDEMVEIYLKAADVMVLPYRGIFQSGALFLAYRFGLPVIATDVGSFKEDIIEGQTGFVCRPDDPLDMAKTIETYFSSGLFADLEMHCRAIRDYANERYSWERIGELTRQVYERVLQE